MSTPITIRSAGATNRRPAWRSIAAVAAGLLAVVILSTATDFVLEQLGVFPPLGQRMSNGLFAVALAYRVVITIFGCWLAARLAPANPMRHALILGAIGVVLGTVGAVVNAKTNLGPDWYTMALVVTALPCAWAGGALHRPRPR
jgi:hypothetical protein